MPTRPRCTCANWALVTCPIAFSDGEVRQEFSICFSARPIGGAPRTSDESSEVRWVERDQLGDLDVHPSIRLRIEHGFADRTEPYYT